MTRYMYLVKDDVANDYEYFGIFNNDALAIRAFRQAVKQSGVPAGDLSLYLACGFNTANGNIDKSDLSMMPTFLCRGENEE